MGQAGSFDMRPEDPRQQQAEAWMIPAQQALDPREFRTRVADIEDRLVVEFELPLVDRVGQILRLYLTQAAHDLQPVLQLGEVIEVPGTRQPAEGDRLVELHDADARST